MMNNSEDDESVVEPSTLVSQETQIVMEDGVVKAAGDLETGDLVATVIDDQEGVVTATFDDAADSVEEEESPEVTYPQDKIDLRGESRESLISLMEQDEARLGAKELDKRVRTVGSWENLIVRSIFSPDAEQLRIEDALAKLSEEERNSLVAKIRNDEGKVILQTANIVESIKPGETKSVSGSSALLAFECLDKGGGYRLPLYNSGFSIDLIVPTGNDIQTLFSNFVAADRELGTANGGQYFAYNDVVNKSQILTFLQPLIINSSYSEWRKKGKLWSAIKFPDLMAIIATLAHIMYPKGFEGFLARCTRPADDNGSMCAHVEELKINISSMIVTRKAALNKNAIDHMVATMMSNGSFGIGKIAEYQAGLELEGERISFETEGATITFTMRIPSIMEYVDAGKTFIADIVNEIEGDNNEGRLEQFGLRYIRTFLPWIASVEKVNNAGKGAKTTDVKQITRELEKLEQYSETNQIYDKLRDYIGKVQLTYVGYPSTPCASCGYTADTKSGMITCDPFSTFFILAFLYLMKTV